MDWNRWIPQSGSKWIKGTELEIIIAGHSVERSKVERFCTCLCLFGVRQGWLAHYGKQDYAYPDGDSYTTPDWCLCAHDRFISILFYQGLGGCERQRATYGNKTLILLAEVMRWDVSPKECDVLHPEHTIMEVQMARWKMSPHMNS